MFFKHLRYVFASERHDVFIILFSVVYRSLEMILFRHFMCKTLQTEETAEESQKSLRFSTAPELVHMQNNFTCSRRKHGTDRRSDITLHLPEAITRKKAKLISDQTQEFN